MAKGTVTERRYAVRFTGTTSLLMHHDNLDWQDVIKEWLTEPANKPKLVRGDERCPAWTWIGHLYEDEGLIVIPSDNIMTTIREGGKKCPTGKGKETFMRASQTGITVMELSWPLLVNGKEIPYDPIEKMIGNELFKEHKQLAEGLGFSLFAKRARLSTTSKPVRVRPLFTNWSCQGTLMVNDDTINDDVLANILTYAGSKSGLCDWRPSSPKSPGQYGMFTVEIKRI